MTSMFLRVLHYLFLTLGISYISHNGIGVKGVATETYVSYMSAMKLENSAEGVRLHSHDVKYGSGSGQQSVTAVDDPDDINSHWLVYKASKKEPCVRGEPIKCNSLIRLQHMATKRNLHSHFFGAPLSGHLQEVSAYGENGEGDSGDVWQVVCSGDYWQRGAFVKLKHQNSSVYLGISGKRYRGRIAGQYEVVGIDSPTARGLKWRTAEGVYFHTPENLLNVHAHSEL